MEVLYKREVAGDLGGLIPPMLAKLRDFWRQAEDYQKFLYLIGTMLLISAVIHSVVLIATGGSLEGPVSWRKPILFAESFGLTAISVAWVLTFLPKRRVMGWVLASALGVANFGEVFLVTMQQWRGVSSHFNFETPFDSAVFTAMSVLIGFTMIVILWVTLWAFFSLEAPSSFARAIWIGMVLLCVSQIIGVLTIQNGLANVLDPQTGKFIPAGLDTASIFGAAGSLKVSHALTLHGIQVLTVLAFLVFFANWSEGQRTTAVTVTAVGYTGLVLVTAFQVFNGLATSDLSLLAAVVFGICAVSIAATFVVALVGVQRTLGQALPRQADGQNGKDGV